LSDGRVPGCSVRLTGQALLERGQADLPARGVPRRLVLLLDDVGEAQHAAVLAVGLELEAQLVRTPGEAEQARRLERG